MLKIIIAAAGAVIAAVSAAAYFFFRKPKTTPVAPVPATPVVTPTPPKADPEPEAPAADPAPVAPVAPKGPAQGGAAIEAPQKPATPSMIGGVSIEEYLENSRRQAEEVELARAAASRKAAGEEITEAEAALIGKIEAMEAEHRAELTQERGSGLLAGCNFHPEFEVHYFDGETTRTTRRGPSQDRREQRRRKDKARAVPCFE